jgi:glycosyltransferase involved in cell wall biosynthesis
MHLPFEMDLYCWYRSPARFFPRLVSKLCVRLASRVICVSQTIGNIALQAISSRKVRVIPNWVSLPEPERKRSCAIASSVRLLFVGRLERYKGLHLLIEALRDLPGVSLTVVGDGLFRGELERLSTGLPVKFLGFQSNTARFYEDADIFVNPSLGPEGLPLVSLEAMGRGVPCLFSDLPVHREISSDGVAAALFKTGDQQSLLEQLKRLLSNETLRRQISEQAAASVQTKYSRPVAAKAYLETFELV